MSKNPIINALSASAYIVIIVSLINFLSQTHKADTAGTPLLVLSLLTLSAAIMAFLFFYQPLLLLLDGKKKQAVNLFMQTIGVFAVFTVVILILIISRLI